jgi:molecular chaperone IbpB
MRNYDLSPLLRQWIGFDKLANALQNTGESRASRLITSKKER